uniref:Antennal gustatory receptor 12 n=1 Tax=Dendrolimus punctatus TaxID=238572 RepID=A0A2K8GKY7_9NEOP|nr:antennal gustatory receptor 12 [Dendrolimus punctatus]
MYMSFDLLIALLLSLRCESFYREIKETKRLCIGVMALYQEGPLREKARKMLSLIEEEPPRFNVYDMWQVDASIFVKLISLITSLVVTLLQFAFL